MVVLSTNKVSSLNLNKNKNVHDYKYFKSETYTLRFIIIFQEHNVSFQSCWKSTQPLLCLLIQDGNINIFPWMINYKLTFTKSLRHKLLSAVDLFKVFQSKFDYFSLSTTNVSHFFSKEKKKQKRDQIATFSKPNNMSSASLCSCYSIPALYSCRGECRRGSGGCHAVSILYPWASPQQWPTWESRPGSGINQLLPKS